MKDSYTIHNRCYVSRIDDHIFHSLTLVLGNDSLYIYTYASGQYHNSRGCVPSTENRSPIPVGEMEIVSLCTFPSIALEI